jgi:hypothetical protein
VRGRLTGSSRCRSMRWLAAITNHWQGNVMREFLIAPSLLSADGLHVGWTTTMCRTSSGRGVLGDVYEIPFDVHLMTMPVDPLVTAFNSISGSVTAAFHRTSRTGLRTPRRSRSRRARDPGFGTLELRLRIPSPAPDPDRSACPASMCSWPVRRFSARDLRARQLHAHIKRMPAIGFEPKPGIKCERVPLRGMPVAVVNMNAVSR